MTYFSDYFIKHPVITLVLNAIVILAGLLSFQSLSIREYPEIHFPTLQLSTFYPNASAENIEATVTNPLEDRLAGVENISTMTSESQEGMSRITLRFKAGTNIEKALSTTREAMGLVTLPEGVNTPVIEKKTNSEGPPFIAIVIESGTMKSSDLTHYTNINIKNTFRSVKGVASAEVWGQPYTYAITLDPQRMHSLGINTDEVYDALKNGNKGYPLGKFQNIVPTTLDLEYISQDNLDQLVVKKKNYQDPSDKQEPVFLNQIADTELTTNTKGIRVHVNGLPGVLLAIKRANDANPLEVSNLVKEELAKLNETLPSSIKATLVLDQAQFVRHSLNNVTWSLFEAIFCVLIIVFVFIRNGNATLIPSVTIPISLIGSFIFLKLLGFSINIITLLGMVLAIGLVVDDAIVVLENIHRYVDKGFSGFEAALKGSREIGFAIIGMTITLACVYAPLFFISGPVGDIFIEFAVALAGSVMVSGFVAITLSPFMCAHLLDKQHKILLPQFDTFFSFLTRNYSTNLTKILPRKKTALLMVLISCGLSLYLIQKMPSDIAPKEDRDLIGVFMPASPGEDTEYREQKALEVEQIIKDTREAFNYLVFVGDWGSNAILILKPKSSRRRSAQQIVDSFTPAIQKIPSLQAHPWSWNSGLPGIDQAGNTTNISLIVSTTKDYKELFKTAETLKAKLNQETLFLNTTFNLEINSPGYELKLNPHTMAHLAVTPQQAAKTIEVFFSGDQTLTFSKDGIVYPLTLQSKTTPWGLEELYITNPNGERISLSVFAELLPISKPNKLFHHNQMRSLTLSSDLAPGTDLKSAMKTYLQTVKDELPIEYKTSWDNNAEGFNEAQRSMLILFVLAIIFIYAVLAVLFESFTDPLIILIASPFACLGGLGIQWIINEPVTIYTQIGLITLIGLISKHGILIVEFANQLQKNISLKEAILEASLLRLRPILMTTSAMVFGTLPLVLGNGAGQEAQRAIGIVLIGGLSLGTFLTLFLLPPLYLLIKPFSFRKKQS